MERKHRQLLLETVRTQAGEARFDALLELAIRLPPAQDDRAQLTETLLPIADGSSRPNLHEACFAAIALSRGGHRSADVSAPMLKVLQLYAENPDVYGGPFDQFISNSLLSLRSMVAYALGLFSGAGEVSDELCEVIMQCGYAPYKKPRITFLVEDCLRAIGAIGAPTGNGKRMLELFADQGNRVAQTALQNYGQPWEVLSAKERLG
jgi:hypothetical protein